MNRPIHFEIPAGNPDRAIAFYNGVFGWTFQKWEGPRPYWLITTGPNEQQGINGGMMPRMDPAQPCTNVIDVANVDETIASIPEKGGQVLCPKMPILGMGWLAYCKDTEGHVFGIMQMDQNAA